MRARSSTAWVAAATAMVLALVPAAQAWSQTQPSGSTAAQSPAGVVKTITLITGDQVAVSTDGQYTVGPPPGQTLHTRLMERQDSDGHHLAIPLDVLSLVDAGSLDTRLFDLNELLSGGYNDKLGQLPLLVAYKPGQRSSLQAPGAMTALTPSRELPDLGMVAVAQQRATAVEAWHGLTTLTNGQLALRPGIAKVWLDAKSRLSLDVSVPQIGAPTAWAAGYRGDGVTVGLVDSGVDDSHPDLAGRIVDRVDLTTEADNIDHNGHGTHVASIIGGNGAASDGKYTGVAPHVKFLVAKACTTDGTCDDSAIIAGMTWLAEKGAKIVNLSLGGPDYDGIDPLEEAVETLTAKYGTLFVVASGNDGGWTNSPGSAPSALTVGAVDKKDVPAAFSSHGIVPSEMSVKPEVAAPGVDITAARSKDSSDGSGYYATHSGTSMATPHVTGTAALLLQQNPGRTWQQLKDTIVSTAKGDEANWFVEGAGRVDAARAVTQTASASPASISFGIRTWPHNQPTDGQTITYHNTGTTPLTLNLAVTAHSATGETVPNGLYTVVPTTVTVPAGGDATAQVAGNPQLNPPNYTFLGGAVTATGGAVVLRTPLMMGTEPEMHNITIKAVNRDGLPEPSQYSNDYWPLAASAQPSSAAQPSNAASQVASLRASAVGFAAHQAVSAHDAADGTQVLRLPAGEYVLQQLQWTGTGDNKDYMYLVAPRVVLDKDVTITMDARKAKTMSATPPRADASLKFAEVGYEYRHPDGWAISDLVLQGTDLSHVLSAQIGPNDPLKRVYGLTQLFYYQDRPDQSVDNSPFYYHMAWHTPAGSFFTGFTKTFEPNKIAEVHAHYAAPFPGTTDIVYTYFRMPWDYSRLGPAGAFITHPMTRDEYYYLGDDLRYEKYVQEYQATADGQITHQTQLHDATIPMTAGRSTDEKWGSGVFGPGFQYNPQLDPWSPVNELAVDRTGDTMSLEPSLVSDSASHTALPIGVTGHSTLKRNGATIGDVDYPWQTVTVPADDAAYEFSTTVSRPDALNSVSSTVSATWTFRSSHTTKEQYLPLSAVRFTPKLDDQNTAPAGRLFAVPFTVQHQPYSTAKTTTSFDVQVSFNNGRTWSKADYSRRGDDGVVHVANPQGHGFVSLKATAKDCDGNEVQETILQAYRY